MFIKPTVRPDVPYTERAVPMPGYLNLPEQTDREKKEELAKVKGLGLPNLRTVEREPDVHPIKAARMQLTDVIATQIDVLDDEIDSLSDRVAYAHVYSSGIPNTEASWDVARKCLAEAQKALRDARNVTVEFLGLDVPQAAR